MVQYTGRSVFLMRKLQTLLRRSAGIQVSLQDPKALEKMVSASEHSGDEQALALAYALCQEQDADLPVTVQRIAVPLLADAKANANAQGETVSMAIPPILTDQQVALDERICEILSDYCGAVSVTLFQRSWEQLACRDIYQDFDRLIDCLSAEISDQLKRIEFREKCQKLV